MGKSTSVKIPTRAAYAPKQHSVKETAGAKTRSEHGMGGLMPARRDESASLKAAGDPLLAATKDMHSTHSKHLSQKLPLHERPENTVEGQYGSLVKGQAQDGVGQYSTEHPGVKFGEIQLPNSSSLMDETAKMVKFLNTDLPRLCRMDPEHLAETEASSLSMFLKFARSIKELRLSKGDMTAAVELESWHDDIGKDATHSNKEQAGNRRQIPAGVRLDTNTDSTRPRGGRAGARTQKQAWEENPYHAGGWAPPVETYGLEKSAMEQGPDVDMILGDELRNMRFSLKVSGKAQTSDGDVMGRMALPRGYGGAAHNFQPSQPGSKKGESVRGDKRPCFKRPKEPDYLSDSVNATLAELRDAERSIVARKKIGVEEARRPVEAPEGWYAGKGTDFANNMNTFMKNLNAGPQWSSKDEGHYQSALEKTGLDLSKRNTNVDNPRKTFGKKR